MFTNPLLLTDFYKVGHIFQYPDGTELVYSNMTPRSSRLKGVDHMVVFGVQYGVFVARIDEDRIFALGHICFDSDRDVGGVLKR